MLRSLNELEKYGLHATDGDIGHVADFFFDDERWRIRYLVVETARFLDPRRVLISPVSFGALDGAARRFQVDLTKDKIKGSPSVDWDKPVSRQHETEQSRYYGYAPYWGSSGVQGSSWVPSLLAVDTWNDALIEPSGDAHLRSAREVHHYHIQGTDGSIGLVADFVIDDETWEVRYLAIDTSWWFGKKVLVPPHWASSISWEERKVHLELPRSAIQNSPEWRANAPIDREYETRLHEHYGRKGYWATET